MVKTYILAPNWTTAPPPNGPIKLGHLLNDLTEFVPLNRDGFVGVPSENINEIDTKTGFQMTRVKVPSGELNIFAKILGVMGVGIGASVHYKKEKNKVLSCKTLDTMTFDPTTEYIANSMDHPAVKRYMQGCRFKAAVYMITGLKIGRGSSLVNVNNRDASATLEAGIDPPGGRLRVGGAGGVAHQRGEGESWEESTDFIVAFRVRKIWYDNSILKDKTHRKSVAMHDGAQARAAPGTALQTGDGISGEDIRPDLHAIAVAATEGEEDENWIIPTDVTNSA